MAMPIGGVRRPVTIVDCDGQEVTITDGKLDVNAVVNVPGDTPEMFTATQDLAVGPLDATDAIADIKEALWFMFHITDPLVAAQVLTVTIDSGSGPTFDSVMLRETLPIGTQDKYFSFPCKTLLRATDHVRFQLANAGGSETGVVSFSAMYGT